MGRRPDPHKNSPNKYKVRIGSDGSYLGPENAFAIPAFDPQSTHAKNTPPGSSRQGHQAKRKNSGMNADTTRETDGKNQSIIREPPHFHPSSK